ncbi:MAD3 protein, partial [Brachypteracias leptosomus]|nr:MAD3 protein [Brachypteracias leptosomus]
MEPAVTSIQVLLQAAEFLERRERGVAGPRYPPGLAEAEHGYASLCPARSRRATGSGAGWRPAVPVLITGVFSRRSVHNALEKHRYRGRGGGAAVGQGRPCPLEEQDLRARKAKDRLRSQQRSLRQRLEQLLLPASGERVRADSLDSSQLSEPSEGEDAEIEVDGAVFGGDLLHSFGTRRDHSYSSPRSPMS